MGGHVRGWYLSPEKVAEDSQAVARVSIQRVAPVIIKGRVWTEVHCLVQEVWRGELGETIIVRQAGGNTPELRTEAGPRPDFKAGQEWILAVVEPPFGDWTLMGLNQGAWVISGDKAVRDYSGFSFIEPPPINLEQGRFERVPALELQAAIATQDQKPPALAPIDPPDSTSPAAPVAAIPAQANPPAPSPAPIPFAASPAPFPWGVVVTLIILILAFIIFRRSRS